jgi:uncharacterized membrane protein YkvA (DUF1232 family)
MMVQILIGFGTALVVGWLILGALLLAVRAPGQSAADMVRVFPAALRLVTALYRDPELPKSVRWRLWVALIYNIQPINLIPDFIPVIGFADNVVVLAWALRSTVRHAGPDAVQRHWKGSPASLAALYRVLRLPGTSAGSPPCTAVPGDQVKSPADIDDRPGFT